jgi:hypothetical protein
MKVKINSNLKIEVFYVIKSHMFCFYLYIYSNQVVVICIIARFRQNTKKIISFKFNRDEWSSRGYLCTHIEKRFLLEHREKNNDIK